MKDRYQITKKRQNPKHDDFFLQISHWETVPFSRFSHIILAAFWQYLQTVLAQIRQHTRSQIQHEGEAGMNQLFVRFLYLDNLSLSRSRHSIHPNLLVLIPPLGEEGRDTL
ncbi:hypothetical protein IQ267_05640 [filamentous cyanobacterium LEGE 07170]|nr:hypothetical protein [filamentous cyanobacterium LEGE 07170]